jgi:hypothetical protein
LHVFAKIRLSTLIFLLLIFAIFNLSHMSEAAQKSKKIAKAGPGRQVRLWVRAKFLSFRRYERLYVDQRSLKIPTKPSSASRESTIALLLNTISARESPTFTKPTQARPRTGSEPSGAGSPEATEIVEPFWPGLPPTSPPELSAPLLELCCSPKEADLILFKHHSTLLFINNSLIIPYGSPLYKPWKSKVL